MSDQVDVVLVEDHPTFRLGLKGRLDLEPDLAVVARRPPLLTP